MTWGKSRKGFANMDPDRLAQVSSLGGRSVAKGNRGFAKNREAAKAAAKKRWNSTGTTKEQT